MIVVRGYAGKALLFQERVDVKGLSEEAMLKMATEQLERLLPFPRHMVEIEFVDEPNVNLRFLRFGTDTSRMRDPKEVQSVLDHYLKTRGPG